MRRRSGGDAVMPRRRMRPACATMQRATVSAPRTHLSDFDAPHGARQPATELLGGPTEVGEILAELEICGVRAAVPAVLDHLHAALQHRDALSRRHEAQTRALQRIPTDLFLVYAILDLADPAPGPHLCALGRLDTLHSRKRDPPKHPARVQPSVVYFSTPYYQTPTHPSSTY